MTFYLMIHHILHIYKIVSYKTELVEYVWETCLKIFVIHCSLFLKESKKNYFNQYIFAIIEFESFYFPKNLVFFIISLFYHNLYFYIKYKNFRNNRIRVIRLLKLSI